MKKTLILVGLIACLVGVDNVTTAQTTKPKKKQTTQAKSPDAEKTRSRRTAASTSSETPTAPVAAPAESKPEVIEPSSKPEAPRTTDFPEPTIVPADDPKTPAKTEPAVASNASTSNTKPVAPADPVTALREQIDAAPTDAERIQLRLKLAELFVAEGKKQEALTELGSITATDVFDPTSFYNAGNSLARLGDSEGAIGAYRKAIEQKKGNYSRAFNNLGVVLLRVGRWDESYEALSSALKLENFRYAEASYNLGRLYSARGQSDLAAREWQRVLKMNPQHAGAKDALGRVRTEDSVGVDPTTVAARPGSAGSSAAEKPFGPAVSDKPAGPTVSENPAALKPSSTTASANTKALLVDQASYDFLQRARTSVERGNMVAAIEDYKRVISRQGGYFAPANLEVSYSFLSLKRYDEALTNLLLVANRDGDRFPISYFHLARLYEMKGDLPQAQAAFSKAVKAFGFDNPQFYLDVSRVSEKRGDFKGALAAMEFYLGLMKQRGQEPSWAQERLTELRQKASNESPPKK